MYENDMICRFCLRVVEDDYVVIDDVIKGIFQVLLLKTHFYVIENPIICKRCTQKAMEIFNFKSTLIAAEERILSMAIRKQQDKVNLKEDNGILSRTLTRCRFCMGNLGRGCFTVDNLMCIPIFKAMAPQLLLEVDLNISKDTAICRTCKHHLESYCNFAWICLCTEKTINTYYREKTSHQIDKIELKNVMQYLTEKHIPICELVPEVREIEFVSVKIEEPFLNDDKSTSQTQIYACDNCSFQTKYKSSLKRHTVSHQKDSGIRLYKCTFSHMCTYKTMRKKCIEKHLLVHESSVGIPTYTCQNCNYETRNKSHFKTHEIIHKDSSEVEIHKCPLCTYETRYKRYIQNHLLTHKDPSELMMHKCDSCPYKAKEKRNLKLHRINHRAVSQVETYKCTLCPFETRHKRSLRTHGLVHIAGSEAAKFKCANCSYETVYKYNLQKHALVHRRELGLKVYHCGLCEYETRYKGDLKVHSLLHGNSLNVE